LSPAPTALPAIARRRTEQATAPTPTQRRELHGFSLLAMSTAYFGSQ
jgi:hypothetical protein